MHPTKILPENYISLGTLDLSTDRRKLIQMNILAFGLLLLSAWLFGLVLVAIRPAAAEQISLSNLIQLPAALSFLLLILLVTGIMLVLHEAAHGIFFWHYTHQRPLFAVRLNYAYAAAPEWYIPKRQYLVVALAPLVLLDLLAVGLAFIVPAEWLLGLWALLILNTSGAIGDLWVVGWLLRQPDTCLANDRGDAVTLYKPG